LLEWLSGLPAADFRSAIRHAAELRDLALATWQEEMEQAGFPALNLPQQFEPSAEEDEDPEEGAAEASRMRLTRNQRLRARLPLFFDIMATWYRDALLIKVGRSAGIINDDMREALATPARRSVAALAAAVVALAEAKDHLRRYSNVDLTLENLLLRLLIPE
jgi:hypothetical protein